MDRQRAEEIAREVIRRGDFDHLVNSDRDVRLGRNNQDDWSLRYSIRDIPTFDGKGNFLPHTHMIELVTSLLTLDQKLMIYLKSHRKMIGKHHKAVIKDVVSKFKISFKGKPRLWFEMPPTPADEPKTKEACEKMVSSLITEHNPTGITREQQLMAWKNLKWDPVQERLDDFVYILRRIGQELGKSADELE